MSDIEKIKAALKPFAELSDVAPDDRAMTMDTWIQSYMQPIFKERLKKLTIGDLRRAAEAYAALEAKSLIEGGGVDELMLLREAAHEFIRKVDVGEAKSTRSYQQFKAALSPALVEEGVVDALAKWLCKRDGHDPMTPMPCENSPNYYALWSDYKDEAQDFFFAPVSVQEQKP